MKLVQSSVFLKQVKKLHENQKNDLDDALRKIIQNPSIGDLKKGDLAGVQVYKFKMVNQLALLAYEFNSNELVLFLLYVGSHENFYRDLKKK